MSFGYSFNVWVDADEDDFELPLERLVIRIANMPLPQKAIDMCAAIGQGKVIKVTGEREQL